MTDDDDDDDDDDDRSCRKTLEACNHSITIESWSIVSPGFRVLFVVKGCLERDNK